MADEETDWRAEALALRELVKKLRAEIAGLRAQNEMLLRKVFGRSSEKMPPMDREVQKSRDKSNKKRRKRNDKGETEAKAVESEPVDHAVPENQRECPNCPGTRLIALLPPEKSYEYEYVAARLKRRVHLREKLACPKGCGCIVTAPAPTRVYDKAKYGPALFAHIITAKCADAIPLYRQSKQFSRMGMRISRSTLTDLFHRAAGILEPLVKRMFEIIAQSSHVMADETTFRIQEKGGCRKGYVWTFIANQLIGYRFSPSRSGETPRDVLGGTSGKLLVDGYTGYNVVCEVEGRTRAGCLSHMRRKFFDAKSNGKDDADYALDLVLKIYQIEWEADASGVVGTERHLELRQTKTKPLMDELYKWVLEKQARYPPKSPMGRALGYTVRQWDALTQFLSDPALPPDNNESERRLRLIALGRKNYLFACDDEGASNLATLMSLVVTCEANDIDPEEYLADVLIRIQTHPSSDIDLLLPPAWKLHFKQHATTEIPAAA